MTEMEKQKLKISEDLLNFSYYFFVKNECFEKYNDKYSKLIFYLRKQFYCILFSEYINIHNI